MSTGRISWAKTWNILNVIYRERLTLGVVTQKTRWWPYTLMIRGLTPAGGNFFPCFFWSFCFCFLCFVLFCFFFYNILLIINYNLFILPPHRSSVGCCDKRISSTCSTLQYCYCTLWEFWDMLCSTGRNKKSSLSGLKLENEKPEVTEHSLSVCMGWA